MSTRSGWMVLVSGADVGGLRGVMVVVGRLWYSEPNWARSQLAHTLVTRRGLPSSKALLVTQHNSCSSSTVHEAQQALQFTTPRYIK